MRGELGGGGARQWGAREKTHLVALTAFLAALGALAPSASTCSMASLHQPTAGGRVWCACGEKGAASARGGCAGACAAQTHMNSWGTSRMEWPGFSRSAATSSRAISMSAAASCDFSFLPEAAFLPLDLGAEAAGAAATGAGLEAAAAPCAREWGEVRRGVRVGACRRWSTAALRICPVHARCARARG